MEAINVTPCSESKYFKTCNECGNAKLCVTAFVNKSQYFFKKSAATQRFDKMRRDVGKDIYEKSEIRNKEH